MGAIDATNIQCSFDEMVYYQVIDEKTGKNQKVEVRPEPIKSMKPERDQLKEDIRTLPMVQVGKKYFVSDNAVRKWCKTYNLPSKVSEIKKYTDEEWKTL
jgi:hypothetical protein